MTQVVKRNDAAYEFTASTAMSTMKSKTKITRHRDNAITHRHHTRTNYERRADIKAEHEIVN